MDTQIYAQPPICSSRWALCFDRFIIRSLQLQITTRDGIRSTAGSNLLEGLVYILGEGVQFERLLISSMQRKHQLIEFSSHEEAQSYANISDRLLLLIDDQLIDATSFAQMHPGGSNTLESWRGKDIAAQIKMHFPLAKNLAESMLVGHVGNQREKILDCHKPLVKQIWALNHQQYKQVVNSPHWFFVPSPKLFENSTFEMISISTWWHVAILPLIVIGLMFWKVQDWSNFHALTAFLIACLGAFLFTLTQYLLHRFIFHADWYLPDVRALRMLHFFLHGIHHMLPNDPSRLVLPPPFAGIIILLTHQFIIKYFWIENPLLYSLFWSGYLIGYVVYDSTHYFLHFLDTSKHPDTYFHRLQKYHNQHHYGGEHNGFGVSSRLWDIIFRTQFKLQRTEKIK